MAVYVDYLIEYFFFQRKNLSDVMFKQQNIQMVFNHLRDELAEYEKRLKQEEETYGGLLQIRKKDLKDLEVSIIRARFLHMGSEIIICLVLSPLGSRKGSFIRSLK